MILRSSFILIVNVQFSLALFGWIWSAGHILTDYMDVETCRKPWITDDIAGLESDLRERVYGQPFVKDTVIPVLSNFVLRPQHSRKALALSFHGTPGTGKNYVADFIAKRLYKRGFKSKFVHYFKGATHFTNPNKVHMYREDLKRTIEYNTQQCHRQLFIFDEVQLMPDGIIDVIRGFIDYEASAYKASYKNTIFLFLSNIAREEINKETMNHWKQGVKREEFSLFPFQQLIANAAFDEKGGLKTSTIISSSLIDIYVPFLPLEKEHVMKCIRAEFRRLFTYCGRNKEEQIINGLASTIDYEPENLNLYAAHGCKNLGTYLVVLAKRHNCYEAHPRHDEI